MTGFTVCVFCSDVQIAEEIELLTLESTDNESTKFRQWKEYVEDDFAMFRRM